MSQTNHTYHNTLLQLLILNKTSALFKFHVKINLFILCKLCTLCNRVGHETFFFNFIKVKQNAYNNISEDINANSNIKSDYETNISNVAGCHCSINTRLGALKNASKL